ncbi:ATP-binding protein [Paenibacillus ferrarius]|uniref:sensor histidine kinase n=1 Tax=Paenibacillus ferrarius TaxID=1469647 RepID=UPI003D2714E4
MNVRAKLFLVIALLVILVSAVYFGTTQGYLESRFSRYSAAEMADRFEAYYEAHSHSWEGVELTDFTGGRQLRKDAGFVLLSQEGHLIFAFGEENPDTVIRQGAKQAIIVNSTKVGTVYTFHFESNETAKLKAYILHTMAIEGIRVALFTAAIAFLLGFWMTWRLTQPLKRMIPFINNIASGVLRTHIPVTTKDEYGKVTEALNRMAQQLHRAEETRKQLTADVVHELRTPLAIIQSQLENIQNGGRQIYPEVLLPIQDEVIRLTRLIEDLHQLTLAESRTLPLARRPTDLVTLIDHVIDRLIPLANDQQITLVRTPTEQTWTVNVDPHRMTQVFYNVLSNALRYTPSGGAITIEIAHGEQAQSHCAVVSITDTGMGIPSEKLPYVFDRFYRVEEARSRHNGGMGLGLAIAKEFVEAHEGSISVQSTVGRGTTFKVSLPLT